MNMPVFQGFDASNYQAPSFGVLPKGWYKSVISASEMKPTQKGGMYIQMTFDIIEGFAKGRKIFARYNVINDNEDTVRIAYEQLGALSHAVGVIRWQQPSELHGKPLNLRLKVVDGKGDYEDSNEPNGYANINDPVKYAVKGAEAPANAAVNVASPFPGAGNPAAASTPFPGAAQQPIQQAANPFPQQQMQQQAPVQQQQAPVQQQVAPQQNAAAQPWATGAAQPWDNPANNAAPQQQAPVQQQQQAAVQEAAPQQQVQQPWAQQVAQPGQAPVQGQQAQPQQQAEPHPAQAAVPPWQQQ